MRVFSDDVAGALTILGEAEGEIYTGKIAVGEVIRERMRQGWFSDGTVIGTVFRRAQFSVWNDAEPRRIKILQTDDDAHAWADCLQAWRASADSQLVPGAVQYFNPKVVLPKWLEDFDPVGTIGRHQFLKRKGT